MSPYRPALLGPADGRLPTRATACGCIVRGGAVLLEHRPADAEVTPDVWDLPGGHVEGGETPEATLVRELREELGITPARFRLGLAQDEDDPRSGAIYRHYTFLIEDLLGEPSPRVGQPLHWLPLASLDGRSGPDAAIVAKLNPAADFALRLFLRHGWVG